MQGTFNELHQSGLTGVQREAGGDLDWLQSQFPNPRDKATRAEKSGGDIYHNHVYNISDIKDSNLALGNTGGNKQEISKNKENETEKEALTVHKQTRNWTVIIAVLTVLLVLLTLKLLNVI